MELDPTERALAQSVYEMDEHDLLVYCQESSKRVSGRPLPIDGQREVGQLRWLRRIYGPDAGLMLRKIFNDYHGQLGDRTFSFSLLARSNRAALDEVYFALRKPEDEHDEAKRRFLGL